MASCSTMNLLAERWTDCAVTEAERAASAFGTPCSKTRRTPVVTGSLLRSTRAKSSNCFGVIVMAMMVFGPFSRDKRRPPTNEKPPPPGEPGTMGARG